MQTKWVCVIQTTKNNLRQTEEESCSIQWENCGFSNTKHQLVCVSEKNIPDAMDASFFCVDGKLCKYSILKHRCKLLPFRWQLIKGVNKELGPVAEIIFYIQLWKGRLVWFVWKSKTDSHLATASIVFLYSLQTV